MKLLIWTRTTTKIAIIVFCSVFVETAQASCPDQPDTIKLEGTGLQDICPCTLSCHVYLYDSQSHNHHDEKIMWNYIDGGDIPLNTTTQQMVDRLDSCDFLCSSLSVNETQLVSRGGIQCSYTFRGENTTHTFSRTRSTLTTTGEAKSAKENQSDESSSKPIMLALGIILLVMVLNIVLMLICYCVCHRSRHRSDKPRRKAKKTKKTTRHKEVADIHDETETSSSTTTDETNSPENRREEREPSSASSCADRGR